jgi:NADH-quinone oxidoreductase subunit M
LKDLNGREALVLTMLGLAVLALGLWPAPLLDMMRASIHHLVDQAVATKLPV